MSCFQCSPLATMMVQLVEGWGVDVESSWQTLNVQSGDETPTQQWNWNRIFTTQCSSQGEGPGQDSGLKLTSLSRMQVEPSTESPWSIDLFLRLSPQLRLLDETQGQSFPFHRGMQRIAATCILAKDCLNNTSRQTHPANFVKTFERAWNSRNVFFEPTVRPPDVRTGRD